MPVVNPKTVTQLEEPDPSLVSSLEERLAALQDDGVPESDPNATAATAQDDAEPTPVKDADSQAATAKPAEPTPAASQSQVEIPAAFVRSAIHQGMTEQDVKDMYEADPEKANKFFSKMHESVNRITEEFARMGRQVQQTPAPVQQPEKKKIDIAKLKETYGEDDPLVKVVQELIESVNPVQQVAQPQITNPNPSYQPNQSPDVVIRQQVTQFFAAPTLKTYQDFYGDEADPSKFTIQQQQNRWKVIEAADHIMAGAALQGRSLSVAEALDRAHLMVSEPYRAAAVRKEIEQKIVKRGKGLTLTPQGSTINQTDANAGKSLEAKTADRLSKLAW